MTREEHLEKLITKYATSYYSGTAEVSDEYFDELVEELRAINPDNKLLTTPGWGFEPTRKYKHWWGLQIGSLPKVQEGNPIPQQYLEDTTRISAKLDGLSVVSYYIGGIRIQCLTRGNGTEGLDVTSKIEIIDPSNHYAQNPDRTPFTGAVRGEVVMPMSVWYDKYEIHKDENPSLNPRNIASGLMNRKEDSDELKDLHYVVYKVLYSEGYKYHDHFDQNCFFSHSFTNKGWHFVECSDKEFLREDFDGDLKKFYNHCCESYPCDGLVFSNYDGIWDEIAYKFQAESVEVTVKAVTWDASRTGKLNPLIWFDPVELSGAMVQKCTGYNAAFIKDNEIGIGAVVEVCRSNEVIPKVLKVIKTSDNVELPILCPKCNSEVHWSGVDLVCDYENESQLAYHFITTLAPVDGAGWSLYNNLVKTFGLTSVESLSNFLNKVRITPIKEILEYVDLRGFISGTVTLEKTKQIFNELAVDVNPVNFLTACNIPKISSVTAEAILQEYPRFIQDLIGGRFNLEDVTKIKGIGTAVLDSLRQFRDRITSLGACMDFEEIVPKKACAFKVAITGALSVKRADFDEELRLHGIEQSGNFKEIKYLITNNPDTGSSKMQNAKKYGIEIISESEFRNKYLID